MQNAKRVWSAKLPKGVESLVLCNSPLHADECLIHAWDALRAIGMDPSPENYGKNAAYAKNCLAKLKVTLDAGSKVKHRKLFDLELAELKEAIDGLLV